MSGIRNETTSEAVQKRRRRGLHAFPKLCLAAALALAAGTASGATTLPAASVGPKPDIKADYTVYIGGLQVATGSMMATLGGETYLLENTLGSAGVAARFWDAHWTMTSKGTISEEAVRPSLFEFSATEKSKTKSREIRYDGRGVPSLTFEPPEPEEETAQITPRLYRHTLDPVSAFLLPVATDGNPCDRSLPIFDGKRRYDLQLTFHSETSVTTRDGGYSGEAIKCRVRVKPGDGMEPGKLTNTLERRDDTWIWLAPVGDGSLYIPVRVQMRTPIGGAVLDVVKLHQNKETTVAAAE